MKRTILAASVLVLGAAGTGVSLANPPSGGPQTYGTCTAYFSGSQTGQDHKHQAGPFQDLQNTAESAESADAPGAQENAAETAPDVHDYCANSGPGGK